MLVQIYALTTADDVRSLVEIGVDHLGFAIDVPPAGISISKARELFKLVPADKRTTALTTETDVNAIIDIAESLEPDVLHIASETEAVSVDALQQVRERLSFPIEIEKSIDITEPAPVETACRFDSVSDFLLLDSNSDDVTGVGASGETHDWSISREITEAVDSPTILAGGLDPENVGPAIRTVQPQGVDSFTQTSKTYQRKDIDAVRAFVEAAQAAADDIE